MYIYRCTFFIIILKIFSTFMVVIFIYISNNISLQYRSHLIKINKTFPTYFGPNLSHSHSTGFFLTRK